MKRLLPAVLLFWSFAGAVQAAEEYTFTLEEIEKKPYHVGGFVELRPILFGLDREAAFYELNLFDQEPGDTVLEYNGRLWLDASVQKGIAAFYLQMNTDYRQSEVVDATSTTRPYQAFLSLKPTIHWTVETGKKTSKWGKGYAWNPAAFIDRPKDPDDPELALEGFTIASADYIRSFPSGPLKTFSFTPVILPVYGDLNDDFGESGEVNFAGKVYLLLYDTDIDLMFLTGGSRTPRYGMDFSRNLGTNLEVHGEIALVEDFTKTSIDEAGNISRSTHDEVNYLLGTRYLSKQNTTYIFEYYYQGTGFSEDEITDYLTFVRAGYDAFFSGGDTRGLRRAAAVTQGNYGRFTPGKHYLYLRASHPDPFDILYFTPALTWIFHLEDQSFSISPEVLYTGVKNLELRLKGTVLAGEDLTEFGEKQSDYRIELRARYFF
jgi:hypothetical protein